MSTFDYNSPEFLRLMKELARLDKEDDAYGEYRRASEASESGSSDKSDPSPGRAKALDAYQRAKDALTNKGSSKGTGIVIGPGGWWPMGFLGDFPPNTGKRTPTGKWCPPWMSGELGRPNAAISWMPHSPPNLEGVEVGEIVAWRAWYWMPEHKRLRSIFVDYEWPTDNPATGEPWNGYGIHAFKHPDQVWDEYIGCHEDLVMGQVLLWGDVVEYEGGYTSEFAKIASVHTAPKCTTKDEVKKIYGVRPSK